MALYPNLAAAPIWMKLGPILLVLISKNTGVEKWMWKKGVPLLLRAKPWTVATNYKLPILIRDVLW